MLARASFRSWPILLIPLLLAACAQPATIPGPHMVNAPTITPSSPPTATSAPTSTPTPLPTYTMTPSPSATIAVPTVTPIPSLSPDGYPDPLPFLQPVNGIEMSGCPDLTKVETMKSLPVQDALETINSLNSGETEAFQQASDKTSWTIETSAQPPLQANDIQINPASQAPYASLIKVGCGERALELSWWVQAGSGALATHYFLINRAGHWLVWSRYP